MHDVFFDERSARLRYIVVDTGRWLPGKEVLLAPAAIGGVDAQEKALTTRLTRQQVKDSPGIESDRPVSRQEELRIHQHYGWNPYWMYPAEAGLAAPMWGGMQAAPLHSPPESLEEKVAAEEAEHEGDPNLRSAREVRGYYVAATDGEVGTIDDFLIDGRIWAIAYLIVDTGSWLSSRPVLVAPDWLRRIDWAERHVSLDLSRTQIETSPPYDRSRQIDEAEQRRLAEHYGRAY